MENRWRVRRARGWHRGRAWMRDQREVLVWALGLLCGLGAAAVNDSLPLPFGLGLALTGGVPLLGFVLTRLLRPRRRAVVWEEVPWHAR